MDIHEFAEILITRGRTIIIGVRDMAIIIGVRVTVTVRHMVRAGTPDGATSPLRRLRARIGRPVPAKRDRFSA